MNNEVINDFGMKMSEALIAKGFTPVSTKGPLGESTSWDPPASRDISWPTAAVLITIIFAFLVVVRGWPF